MANIWLIDALPESLEVTERHRLRFEIMDNDISQHLGAELDGVLRIPVDGNCYLKQRSLTRAGSAQSEGGQARLGILGLAAAEHADHAAAGRGRRRGGVTTTLKGLDQSQPLYVASDGSVVTWPLDLPLQVETNLAQRPTGSQDQVCVYKIHLPVSPPELYPLTLGAELQVLGDDLPYALERLSDLEGSADKAKCNAAVIQVAKAISRPVSDRSVFCLMIGINVSPPRDGSQLNASLVRLVLDWPPGGDGRDIILGRFKDLSTAISGRYDPVTGQAEFLLPKATSKALRLDDQHPGITLVLSDPTVLSGMGDLKGVIEVEVDGLVSGLRPFMADVSGRIVTGLEGESGARLAQRTTLTAEFLVNLAAKFRARPVAQQIRLQFPGRRFREDQLRQVKTLFRDFAFTDPADYPLSANSGAPSHLLCAGRTEGGDKQYLAFQIVPEKRKVSLEHALGGTTTETRTEELDDITVDMAAVGPNHAKISKLLADLQPGVASILGVR